MQKLSTPPTTAEIVQNRQDTSSTRKGLSAAILALIACAVFSQWVLPDEQSQFFAGMVLGVILFFVLIFFWVTRVTLDGLAPASPDTCLMLEPTLTNPDIAAYVSAVQQQDRLLTEGEANNLLNFFELQQVEISEERKAQAFKAIQGRNA